MLLLRTLVFIVIVPATLVVYVPGRLAGSFASHGLIPNVAGGLLAGAGLLLTGWCWLDFIVQGRGTPAPWDPPRRLVTSGPYRRVRNPIYVGVLAILLGEAVFFESMALLVWALLIAFFFHLVVVIYEEPGLRRRFGSDYERYLASVPRWLPRLRRGAQPCSPP